MAVYSLIKGSDMKNVKQPNLENQRAYLYKQYMKTKYSVSDSLHLGTQCLLSFLLLTFIQTLLYL